MTNLLILLTLPPDVCEAYRARLSAAFPELRIDVVDNRDKVGPVIGDSEILMSFGPMMSDKLIAEASKLRWIQALGTGVDGIVDQPSLKPEVIVTNISGIHGPPVSEAAIASMLALSRDLPRAVRAQDGRRWERFPARLISGKTVAILGIGVIAEELAPKCKAMGMTVLGITGSPREVAGFDRVYHRDAFGEAVRAADFLVLLTPLTTETRGIVDADILAQMKPTSVLVNLARGGVVDDPALVAALQQGRLAGAVLDVFPTEPLPADHPYWDMKNVIMTTHQGGFCDVYPDLAWPVLEANFRAFLAGDTGAMVNIVSHHRA